jgi:hypothetical protein
VVEAKNPIEAKVRDGEECVRRGAEFMWLTSVAVLESNAAVIHPFRAIYHLAQGWFADGKRFVRLRQGSG